MVIELIRHGVTAWVAERRYQGHTDIPLSPEGMAMLKESEESPEYVYVSPLMRARQSAQILFPNSEQRIIESLSEMNFGVFEGRTADEMADDPEYREWVDGFCNGDCPGGEGRSAFDERVRSGFEEIISGQLAAGAAKCTFVVHGGVIMSLMEAFADKKKSFYEWFIQPGCSYILSTEQWSSGHILVYRGKDSYVR